MHVLVASLRCVDGFAVGLFNKKSPVWLGEGLFIDGSRTYNQVVEYGKHYLLATYDTHLGQHRRSGRPCLGDTGTDTQSLTLVRLAGLKGISGC